MNLQKEGLSKISGGFGFIGTIALLGISIFISGFLHGYTNPSYCKSRN